MTQAVRLNVQKTGPNYWDAYELREGDAFRRVARIAVVDGAPMVMVMPGAALGLSVPMLDALRSAAASLTPGEAQSASSVVAEDLPGKSSSDIRKAAEGTRLREQE